MRPEKDHFGYIGYPRVGLDRAWRARVAPNLEQIMGQTYQTPLTTNVGQAAQQKPAKTTRFFDLAEHRFHDHFASGVQSTSFGSTHFCRHALFGSRRRFAHLSLRYLMA